MSKSAISYVPRSDATPEGELAALYGVYRFVLDHAKKKAVPDRRPEDERKDQHALTRPNCT